MDITIKIVQKAQESEKPITTMVTFDHVTKG